MTKKIKPKSYAWFLFKFQRFGIALWKCINYVEGKNFENAEEAFEDGLKVIFKADSKYKIGHHLLEVYETSNFAKYGFADSKFAGYAAELMDGDVLRERQDGKAGNSFYKDKAGYLIPRSGKYIGYTLDLIEPTVSGRWIVNSTKYSIISLNEPRDAYFDGGRYFANMPKDEKSGHWVLQVWDQNDKFMGYAAEFVNGDMKISIYDSNNTIPLYIRRNGFLVKPQVNQKI